MSPLMGLWICVVNIICMIVLLASLPGCGMSSLELGEQLDKNNKPQLGLEMDFK